MFTRKRFSHIAIVLMTLISFSGFSKINPGEIIVLGFEASTGGSGVQEVWFVALAPLDSGETVYMTDYSIAASAPFTVGGSSKDSWLSFTLGADISVGSTWVIGNINTGSPSLTTARSSVTTSDITSITSGGAFTLSFGNNGDDLILYQGSSTEAKRFIYGVGADPSGTSQLDPGIPANLTRISNWGLTSGLTANFFNNGNSNYKLLGANPALINFNGDIDAILADLGDPANYVYDVGYTLNSTSTSGDLSIGTISPQPSGRYYNQNDGLWYQDAGFTTLAIDPNRTHNVVVLAGTFNIILNDTLDVAGIVVGNGDSVTTVTGESGSYIQTVYGVTVLNNGTFVLENNAITNIGTDVDVNSGGVATLEPGAHLDYKGDLIVNGTMTLNADATGFSSLGLHGTGIQSITGSGTINAELYFANSGWHHLSAPGYLSFADVSFDNGMDLYFTGAQTNVYRWDPAPTGNDPGWYTTTSTSDFGDSAYAIYFFPAHVPTTINLAYVADSMDADVNLSTGEHEHVARYKVPTGNPVNSTDGWLSADNNPSNNGGWNLMKNPYWGHLSWEKVDNDLPANVGTAVYFWNPGAGAYDTWVDGLGTSKFDIVPLLAYFAKAEPGASGQNIRRGQPHVFDGDQNYFGKVTNAKPQLIINASSEGHTTSGYLMFDDLKSANYEFRWDALYRGVNPDQVTFNIVSADSAGLQIDQRPFPRGMEDIYLSYDYMTDGATGRISIDNSFLPRGIYVYLEDIHTGMVADLQAGDYIFTHDANAPRQRFILKVNNTAVSLTELTRQDEVMSAYRNGDQVHIDFEELNGSYSTEVFDMTGRVVWSGDVDFNMGSGEFTFSGLGPLVVRVWNGEEAQSIKLF